MAIVCQIITYRFDAPDAMHTKAAIWSPINNGPRSDTPGTPYFWNSFCPRSRRLLCFSCLRSDDFFLCSHCLTRSLARTTTITEIQFPTIAAMIVITAGNPIAIPTGTAKYPSRNGIIPTSITPRNCNIGLESCSCCKNCSNFPSTLFKFVTTFRIVEILNFIKSCTPS